MSARRIAVVTAGLSNPSTTRMLGDRLADATVAALRAKSTASEPTGIAAEVDVFELRDYAHDITNNLLTGFAPPALETMVNAVVSADAIIAVTPIFSTSYSGLFKSFVDILDPDALTGVPVLLGANAGTARHSLAIDYSIRPLFTYLHANPVPTGVFAASSDWGANADGVAPLGARIDRGARELADAIAARMPVRDEDPYDPATYLGEGRSFGHLLGGLAGE
ncbi:FMN reductase [Microbacterium sp. AG1240]|uniref:CE1759 family FMN reductase n=1 Tax=Microbacterium sp. AG1240 TaxID=2183992 RepID=UPI000EB18A41|nr:CE1759 family FMN reductase [Microbacterium sp. AG1240]RKT33786.1 FMN reductase [Microbacterium sp. AG1240]